MFFISWKKPFDIGHKSEVNSTTHGGKTNAFLLGCRVRLTMRQPWIRLNETIDMTGGPIIQNWECKTCRDITHVYSHTFLEKHFFSPISFFFLSIIFLQREKKTYPHHFYWERVSKIPNYFIHFSYVVSSYIEGRKILTDNI